MVIDTNLITKIKSLQAPAIIGISGFGGSGKTTFANLLSTEIHAPVISIDSFNKGISDYSNWELMDFERLKEDVLIPFKKGDNMISYNHFTDEPDRIPKKIVVQPQGILIIEGVGLIRPALMHYFSYTIWIDCLIDEAVKRGKKRDRETWHNPKDEQWDGIWKKNDIEYYEQYKPQTKADLIIINN